MISIPPGITRIDTYMILPLRVEQVWVSQTKLDFIVIPNYVQHNEFCNI